MSEFISRILKAFKNLFWKVFRKKKKEVDHCYDFNLFPIVSRVFARTISSDLISVQPIGVIPQPENVYSRDVIIEKTGFRTKTEKSYFQMPNGILYYFDYNYGVFNPNAVTRQVLIEKYKNHYTKEANPDFLFNI